MAARLCSSWGPGPLVCFVRMRFLDLESPRGFLIEEKRCSRAGATFNSFQNSEPSFRLLRIRARPSRPSSTADMIFESSA